MVIRNCFFCKYSVWPSSQVSLTCFICENPNFNPTSFVNTWVLLFRTWLRGGSDGKVSACSVGDTGLISGSGRSPKEGNGNPLQYPCLENSMGRGAWQVTVIELQRVGHVWMTNTFHFTKDTWEFRERVIKWIRSFPVSFRNWESPLSPLSPSGLFNPSVSPATWMSIFTCGSSSLHQYHKFNPPSQSPLHLSSCPLFPQGCWMISYHRAFA